MLLLDILEYLFVMIKALCEGWLDVLKRCIRGDINPQVVEIETEIKSLIGQVVLACSITLTPGTLTVDLDPEKRVLKVATIVPIRREDIIPFEPYIKKIFDRD
ncbi:MAG TPA: cation:proton antiporter [Methanothermococcus okinawensis]|uniref:Cation:proton antiporter n=1 Tax=Methanothermococcus okinawensis TaxID=155863 RepID=A0A832ZJS8_9EURY|nr:cation:proton antiporter [Methanothermococcus okinawensis]HIP90777.1 cation:proton antiporter [Methanothermococcus okinawensis]